MTVEDIICILKRLDKEELLEVYVQDREIPSVMHPIADIKISKKNTSIYIETD